MISVNAAKFALLLLASGAGSLPSGATENAGDVVGQAIQGEFALQSGDLAGASRAYLAAARASNDPAVAEHATRVALIADDMDAAASALARWRQLAPNTPVQGSLAILIAMRRGQKAMALAEVTTLLQQPQGWQDVVAPLSDTRGNRGVDARVLIRDLLAHDQLPHDADAWLAFGGLARKLGDDALAQDIERGLVARFPDDARAQLLGAARLRESGDPVAARSALDRVLAGTALTPELRNAAAGELAALGDPKTAAQVLARGTQDDETYAQRASWLSDADDQVGLSALYAEIKAAPITPTRRLLLGEVAELLSRWSEAEQWYRGISDSPLRERAQLRLPSVLEKLGHLDAAIALLRKLQSDITDDGDNNRDAYLQEAELWARRKDDVQTLATYARGLAAHADDALLLYGRGLYQQSQGRIDAALADLKQIIDRDGDNAEALNAYGYTLAESRQSYAEALPFIEKSNRLKPNSAATLDSLGWVELKLGDREKALPLLRQAWALQKDAEIAAHLGEALWLSGDQTGARQIWQAGLAIDAENQPLQAMMRKYPL